jgi:hypothetical protein
VALGGSLEIERNALTGVAVDLSQFPVMDPNA